MLCLFLSTTASVASSAAPPRSLGLPYIEDKQLQAVQTRKYVDLARLLPQKKTKHETSRTTVEVDDKGVPTITSTKPVADIISAEQWCQAFSVYAAYHSFYFPDLAPGILSYMCFLTAKLSIYPLETCLSYDIDFRKRLARYPDTMQWEMPDRDVMELTFRAPGLVVMQAPGPVLTQATNPVFTQTTAPQARPVYAVAPREVSQNLHKGDRPFTAQNGTEVCNKFQLNQCPTPCRFGRRHVCFVCEKPGHTGTNHYAPPGGEAHNQQRQAPQQPKNYQRRR